MIGKDIRLAGIRLYKIQSWDDLEIPINNIGLTCIIAPNNTGKSVLYKGLKVIATPKIYGERKRKAIIRRGNEFGMMAFRFNDGVIYECYIYLKMSKYFKIYPDGTKEFIGDDIDLELKERLDLIISENKSILNLIDMDQRMFLVDSDSASNNDALKPLTSHPDSDLLLTRLNTELIPDLKSKKSDLKIQHDFLEKQLSQMRYVTVDEVRSDTEKMDELLDIAEVLNGLNESFKEINFTNKKPNKKLEKEMSEFIELAEPIETLGRYTLRDRISVDITGLSDLADCCIDLKRMKPREKLLVDELEFMLENQSIMDLKRREPIPNDLSEFIDLFDVVTDLSNIKIRDTIEDFEGVNLLELVNILRVSGINYHGHKRHVAKLKERLLSMGNIKGSCPLYNNVLIIGGTTCINADTLK